MTCWVVIPIKARAACKTRLAPALDADLRAELARRMLAHVVGAARAAAGVDRVLVVSPERDRLPPEVELVQDTGTGLDAALELARAHARAGGAGELAVLAADLPLVTPDEVALLIAHGRRTGFALATDLAARGTNALYLSAGDRFEFAFGPGSRARHVAAAARCGRVPAFVDAAGLATDLDTLCDLRELGAAVGGELAASPAPFAPGARC